MYDWHKNIDCNMLCLSHGQTIMFLGYRSKGYSLPLYFINENSFSLYTEPHVLPDGMLSDPLSQNALQNAFRKDGYIPPYLPELSYTYTTDTKKTIAEDKYP